MSEQISLVDSSEVDTWIWAVSVGKESACSAGDPSSMPGWRRSPGEGNGKSLLYPCLENPVGRGAWQAADQGSQRVRHD